MYTVADPVLLVVLRVANSGILEQVKAPPAVLQEVIVVVDSTVVTGMTVVILLALAVTGDPPPMPGRPRPPPPPRSTLRPTSADKPKLALKPDEPRPSPTPAEAPRDKEAAAVTLAWMSMMVELGPPMPTPTPTPTDGSAVTCAITQPSRILPPLVHVAVAVASELMADAPGAVGKVMGKSRLPVARSDGSRVVGKPPKLAERPADTLIGNPPGIPAT